MMREIGPDFRRSSKQRGSLGLEERARNGPRTRASSGGLREASVRTARSSSVVCVTASRFCTMSRAARPSRIWRGMCRSMTNQGKSMSAKPGCDATSKVKCFLATLRASISAPSSSNRLKLFHRPMFCTGSRDGASFRPGDGRLRHIEVTLNTIASHPARSPRASTARGPARAGRGSAPVRPRRTSPSSRTPSRRTCRGACGGSCAPPRRGRGAATARGSAPVWKPKSSGYVQHGR